MLRRALLTLSSFAVVHIVFGQTAPMETDRPDQTETPVTVPRGWFQLETGWSRGGTAHDGLGLRATTLPTVLAKVGLTRRVEFRLEMERADVRSLDSAAPPVSGLLPVEVGTKVLLFNEQGLRPRTSILLHVGLPKWASPSFQVKDPYGTARIAMQKTLSDRFNLSCNLGGGWDGDTPAAIGTYTISLGAAANDALGLFVEAYGFFINGGSSDHRLDAGATYRIGPNVQFDTSGGFALGRQQWFVSAGFSFRLQVFAQHVVVAP